MSRIAIIDTAVDPKYIGRRTVEHINVCGINEYDVRQIISHGTACAMVLDSCTVDYELVNIQIFQENQAKVYSDINLLANALKICGELKIDVISLSAVSSILSDSKYLYHITCELAKDSVIVSALDNNCYLTIPTSYPHVLGVRNDFAGLLSPGEIAYRANDPFGVNVYANCNFAYLQKLHYGPSNSLAVPVVAAYINNLFNQKKAIPEIKTFISNMPSYNSDIEQGILYYSQRPIKREIPIVFLSCGVSELCGALMDSLYEKYEVQATALSLLDVPYDIRIKKVTDIKNIREELNFMIQHYKTDMIFIIDCENQLGDLQRSIDIDVKITCAKDYVKISYEDMELKKNRTAIIDSLYKILTL